MAKVKKSENAVEVVNAVEVLEVQEVKKERKQRVKSEEQVRQEAAFENLNKLFKSKMALKNQKFSEKKFVLSLFSAEELEEKANALRAEVLELAGL